MDEVRMLREDATKWQFEAEENEEAKGRLDDLYTELRRYFGQDCNSVWLAGDRYKSALNRLSDLEAEKVSA